MEYKQGNCKSQGSKTYRFHQLVSYTIHGLQHHLHSIFCQLELYIPFTHVWLSISLKLQKVGSHQKRAGTVTSSSHDKVKTTFKLITAEGSVCSALWFAMFHVIDFKRGMMTYTKLRWKNKLTNRNKK